MILLAVIVTRSSAASLQAKQGLPLGNQVVGWFVLGKFELKSLQFCRIGLTKLLCSVFAVTSIRPPSVSE